MPAKSEKQRRFMAMAYNDPDMGVPKEVAKKYMKKPAKGFKEGGKLPDLTGDGKVTQADVLKGRGVFKKGGKVGYHRMPDGTMMKDSEHNMKEGGAVKKQRTRDTAADYARRTNATSRMNRPPREDVPAPRRMAAPEERRASKLAPTSTRDKPVPRPDRGMDSSPRPRMRPDDMEAAGAVERGNRASMREAEEMPGMMMGGKVKKMAKGGKVRGAGMAKKGVRACKMC